MTKAGNTHTHTHTISLNSRVRLKLTQAGANVVNADILGRVEPDPKRPGKLIRVPVTYKEGDIFTCQLWMMMYTFGREMTLGGPLMFDVEFEIEGDAPDAAV